MFYGAKLLAETNVTWRQHAQIVRENQEPRHATAPHSALPVSPSAELQRGWPSRTSEVRAVYTICTAVECAEAQRKSYVDRRDRVTPCRFRGTANPSAFTSAPHQAKARGFAGCAPLAAATVVQCPTFDFEADLVMAIGTRFTITHCID